MGSASWHSWPGLAVILALVTACTTSTTASPSPETSTPSLMADGSPSSKCSEIDLRSPSGERVQLAGTWTQMEGTKLFYLSQVGSCVWWAGGFETSATSERRRWDGLGEYSLVFSGVLAPDFTLNGEWSSVRTCGCPNLPSGFGTATMKIDFASDQGLVLKTIEVTGTDMYFFQMLTKISDEAIPPP